MSLQATLKSSAAHYELVANPRTTSRKCSPMNCRPRSDRDRVLDSAQTAKFLGISVPTLRRLYRAKRVPLPNHDRLPEIWLAGRRADRFRRGENPETPPNKNPARPKVNAGLKMQFTISALVTYTFWDRLPIGRAQSERRKC